MSVLSASNKSLSNLAGSLRPFPSACVVIITSTSSPTLTRILQGYRILLNLNRLAGDSSGAGRTTITRHTDTNIQFSTQQFDSQRYTEAGADVGDQIYGMLSRDERIGRGTVKSSQISTLELDK